MSPEVAKEKIRELRGSDDLPLLPAVQRCVDEIFDKGTKAKMTETPLEDADAVSVSKEVNNSKVKDYTQPRAKRSTKQAHG